MRIYIGLVHYPVYNKNYQRIASAITTLDLHDLARLAMTYHVKRFYVITPFEEQQRLARRVQTHWTKGFGAEYNRHRKEALELVEVVPSLDRAIKAITETEGEPPLLIATDASKRKMRSVSFEGARGIIRKRQAAILIFGTAWGLDEEVIASADYVLDPISGSGGYNHLSVRTAAAIILDRLARTPQ